MKQSKTSLIFWIFVIIVGLIIAAIVIFPGEEEAQKDTQPAKTTSHTSGKAWNANMVLGKPDAPHKLIEYSDYFCSFCANFHDAAGEEFEKTYIDTGRVSLETRIITVLSEKSVNTMTGAHAAYCSAEQGKFKEYSNEIIAKIKRDYYSKGIGLGPTYPPIEKVSLDYFLEPTDRIEGLNKQQLSDCITSEKHRAEIAGNTNKAQQLGVNGLPFIVANDYKTSGFVGGYTELQTILKAGGIGR